jgi:hypothetical protein
MVAMLQQFMRYGNIFRLRMRTFSHRDENQAKESDARVSPFEGGAGQNSVLAAASLALARGGTGSATATSCSAGHGR